MKCIINNQRILLVLLLVVVIIFFNSAFKEGFNNPVKDIRSKVNKYKREIRQYRNNKENLIPRIERFVSKMII